MNQLKVANLLIIGSGVAQSSALSGKFDSIVVQDINEKALDVAKARMADSLLRIKKKKRKYRYLSTH